MRSKKCSGKAILSLVVLLILQVACSYTFAEKGSGKISAAEKQPSTINSGSGTVKYETVGMVNIRECPSTTCKVIGVFEKGEVVEGACGSGKWCRVVYNNKNAWVFAPCLGKEGICK